MPSAALFQEPSPAAIPVAPAAKPVVAGLAPGLGVDTDANLECRVRAALQARAAAQRGPSADVTALAGKLAELDAQVAETDSLSLQAHTSASPQSGEAAR